MALFDKSASDHDAWCKTPIGSYVDELEKKMMEEVAIPKKGEVALDIGCGTGIYSIWLQKKGLHVTGVDISNEMLEIAKSKQAKNIDYILGDLNTLPFSNQIFDLVLGNIMLEFIDTPEKVIAEGLRVLKPGGRLVIGMIGKQSEWARMYQKRATEKKKSVFAQAHFYSSKEMEQFSANKPSNIMYGLYVTPYNFENKEQAIKLENKSEEEGAGFIVARWEKI